jgi:hypothetical protein
LALRSISAAVPGRRFKERGLDCDSGWFLRGCEGGGYPRRLALKPARAPPQKPEVKAGQRYQGREAGNVRAGSLASPVEWVLGLPLGFMNGVKPQVTQEGHRTTQGPVWGTE